MQREWDVVVVGLGAIGSAAVHWAAARPGTRVLGLEQFELDHPNGASRDHSRIIRLSYHRRDYVRLARRAYACWAEVEAASGERIVTRTGGLDIFPAGGVTDQADYTGSLEAEGVPFERLGAAETMRRWPQWHLPEDASVVYQADSGIADPNRGNPAHRALAVANGATLLDRTPVASVRADDGGYEVTTADGTAHRAGRVVLAADAWTNQVLAGFGRRLPLTITREQVTYFACPDPAAFAPERFPIWIWMGEPSFYGFPAFGEAGAKIGRDVGGPEVTGDTRSFDPMPEYSDMLDAFMRERLPGGFGPYLKLKTCLYTMPPDRDFVLDLIPGHERAAIGQGAAHAFKFASVFGKSLTELVFDGKSESDVRAWSAERASLTAEDPPKRLDL